MVFKGRAHLEPDDLGPVEDASGMEVMLKTCGDLWCAMSGAMWSDGGGAREGLASLDTTGEHTGLCRSAVECVPPLQEHELEGRPSGVQGYACVPVRP
jgi:hypothetical protein